jgi:hypothetical protein
MTKQPCPICTMIADVQQLAAQNHFICPRCGRFVQDLGSGGIGWLDVKSVDHRVRLSGWIREENDRGGNPLIAPELSRRIADMALPRLVERASRVLAFVAKEAPDIEAWYDLRAFAANEELQARSYSKDASDAIVPLRLLAHQGLLDEGGSGAVHISVNGLLAVEAMGAAYGGAAQGFVAMWFDASLTDAWLNGFDPGIRAAGYAPMRIDNKEYVGGISDEVMAEIRRSRFVVVDYTGQRNNVYFEAGFTLGLGLTIIPTCRADQHAAVEFDVRHMNTLTWTTPADLASRLSTRIQAVIGAGPNLVG